ncbi:right-handed parallel beta-helix repeat-containing protein [Vibrio mangrovi]|uniref:Right-handed parallel beta-helix repeat-containing protein n=1 Tax=Vibrio mangrovi TaxID=474394 RepID=A0A1Y6J063_9VIBR|nr:right-handed parallel beta-helix repeat-containing protein [Vibrio mangrovi]MDW6005428.1 right-handed parallel beta-helix repeat-containing protein [Vibrio mangrovi]SMS02132.1 hypothetical protein VIM7927_03450 [Vibrio mangrovi]
MSVVQDKLFSRMIIIIAICIFALYAIYSHAASTPPSDPYNYDVMESLLIDKQDPAYDYTLGDKAYYVSAETGSDSNDGSENAPFATILYALSQATGGEVIYVMNGDYGDLKFGANYFENSSKSTPIDEVFTDWVTLKAMPGQHPVLGNVTLGTTHDAGGWYRIDFAQKGNSDLRLRIDGFKITDNVIIRGSRYVDIRNNQISQKGDFASMSLEEKSDYMANAGVHIFNGRYVKVLYNEILNTGVGIWAMTNDLVVKGNHLHHLTHDGLQFHGGSNWLIENNIVHDLDDGMFDGDDETKGVNMHVDGIQVYVINVGGTSYAKRLDNVTIRGNLFYHVESMDFMISGPPQWIKDLGGGYGNFFIENNIFAPSNGSLIILGAGFDGLVFRHNTVLYTPNDQWQSVWGRNFGQTFNNPAADDYYIQTWWHAILDHQPDYYFNNNIVVNTGAVWTSGGDNINANMNIYYSPNNSEKVLDEGRGYTTAIPPYVTIDGKLQDYLDAGHIPGALEVGSLAVDNGYTENALPPLETDFMGNPRDQAPDIGAIELQ